MLHTLIVDDEPKARTVLRSYLEDCEIAVSVMAEAGAIPDAVKLINKEKPDLVFLDIEMPKQNGFALFDYFDEIDFQVIFVTASRDYAIDAFKVSALDYILKPINQQHLNEAVKKAAQQTQHNLKERVKVANSSLNSTDQINRIALFSNESIDFVAVEDILYLKADGPYTEFYLTGDQKALVSKPIGEYDMLEDLPHFMKTHRSYLVNLHKVQSYRKEDGGFILMKNGDSINLSRYRKNTFLDAMESL